VAVGRDDSTVQASREAPPALHGQEKEDEMADLTTLEEKLGVRDGSLELVADEDPYGE
jgi:hypothetical protein